MPAERFEEPAVGSLPAAFCENFAQCGISAIIAIAKLQRYDAGRARIAAIAS
jgi:hypothetical protein